METKNINRNHRDDSWGTDETTYFQEDNSTCRTVRVCKWRKYNQIEISISEWKKGPKSRAKNSSFSLKDKALDDFKKFINQEVKV